MDAKKLEQALKSTKLGDLISAKDIERWQIMDKNYRHTAPLWVSVIIGIASSLDIKPDELNPIFEAAMPKAPKGAYDPQNLSFLTIDPGVVGEPAAKAADALRRGEIERSQALWLEAISKSLSTRMTIAEPYRIYGNLASSAFSNGELLLAEASLSIALKLNPNYTFALNLSDRNKNGEFMSAAMAKIANKPMPQFITKEDLALIPSSKIFAELAKQGIKLDEKQFTKLAQPIKSSLDPLVDKIISLCPDKDKCDEDYVQAAVEILWQRLVTRPVFETFQDILFDLEDSEPDSNLYYNCIDNLTKAIRLADPAVFKYYQKYPIELAEFRYTLHDILSFEILKGSNLKDDLLRATEKLLSNGYFPDMVVGDIITRIANDKDGWLPKVDQLITENPEYAQVLIMGLARGLLETDNDEQVISLCQKVWPKVLDGRLKPEQPEILSIGDYLVAAYNNIGDKVKAKTTTKQLAQIEDMLNTIDDTEDANLSEKFQHLAYNMLKEDNKYPELFAYEDFLISLGLDFSTEDRTNDKLTIFSNIDGSKPGRNEPCPCGSNKKFKKCCGKV